MWRRPQHQAMDPILLLFILLVVTNVSVLGAGATKAVIRTWRAREGRTRQHPGGRLVD